MAKDIVSCGPAVNHINKVQMPINVSDKSNNIDVEVASNGSHSAAEKGCLPYIYYIPVIIIVKIKKETE